MIVLNGEERFECEICIDRLRVEHVFEFKYFRCVLDESCTYEAECRRKVGSGSGVASDIRSLVNVKGLQLMYGSETMLWMEKEISRIRAVQMDSLKGLLGIRRMNKVPNARIRELCEVTKRVDERIDEGVIQLSAIWREWRKIRMLRGFMKGSVQVIAQWVGRGRGGLIS